MFSMQLLKSGNTFLLLVLLFCFHFAIFALALRQAVSDVKSLRRHFVTRGTSSTFGGTWSKAETSSKSLLLISRLENLKAAHKSLINTHHGARVVKFTTIVGRGEKRD